MQRAQKVYRKEGSRKQRAALECLLFSGIKPTSPGPGSTVLFSTVVLWKVSHTVRLLLWFEIRSEGRFTSTTSGAFLSEHGFTSITSGNPKFFSEKAGIRNSARSKNHFPTRENLTRGSRFGNKTLRALCTFRPSSKGGGNLEFPR